MLVTIKPHSSFKSFFSESEYIADFKTYNDILFYLNGMHKRFINYLRLQKAQGIEESFVFLDKKLRVINPDELRLKHARDGDVIHIVPAIIGGGGKRGGLLAVLAVAAFVFLLTFLCVFHVGLVFLVSFLCVFLVWVFFTFFCVLQFLVFRLFFLFLWRLCLLFMCV